MSDFVPLSLMSLIELVYIVVLILCGCMYGVCCCRGLGSAIDVFLMLLKRAFPNALRFAVFSSSFSRIRLFFLSFAFRFFFAFLLLLLLLLLPSVSLDRVWFVLNFECLVAGENV